MNWGDSSIEKNNPEILLPVSSGTKNLCLKNGTSFLVQVSGVCVVGIMLDMVQDNRVNSMSCKW